MVTGFYIDSKDLIAYDSLWVPQNIYKARQYGYEVGLKHDVCKEISHKVVYTTQDQKIQKQIPV